MAAAASLVARLRLHIPAQERPQRTVLLLTAVAVIMWVVSYSVSPEWWSILCAALLGIPRDLAEIGINLPVLRCK